MLAVCCVHGVCFDLLLFPFLRFRLSVRMVCVGAYPTVACPVPQLRQRLNHFRVLAALGEQAQPAGLATLVAGTRGGWQRLTGFCRTLRQQAAEGAVLAEQ